LQKRKKGLAAIVKEVGLSKIGGLPEYWLNPQGRRNGLKKKNRRLSPINYTAVVSGG